MFSRNFPRRGLNEGGSTWPTCQPGVIRRASRLQPKPQPRTFSSPQAPAPPPPPPQHSASTPASSVSFSQRVSGVVCRRRWRWQSPWKESRRVRGRSGWTSPPSIWTPSPSRPARTSASSGRRHAPPLGVPILRKH